MKHNVRMTIILLVMFLLTQLIGLLVLHAYVDVQKTQETGQVSFEELPLGIERPQVEAQTSFLYVFFMVLFGTGLLFLFIRFKIPLAFRIWYFLAVFFTLTISLGAFIHSTLAALLALGLAVWRVFRPQVIVHNLTELFMYGGIAAIFVPIMDLSAGFLVLIFISVYDMYAVWKSKHMIRLAKFQAQSRMFAGLYIPYQLSRKMAHQNSGAVKETKGMKKITKITKKIKTAMLGGGDMAFPLIFAGIVMKEVGFGQVLFIPLGAALALLGLLWWGKEHRFYPAMPFLSTGCFLGYGLMLLSRFVF